MGGQTDKDTPFYVKGIAFRHDVFDQAIEELSAVLHVQILVRRELKGRAVTDLPQPLFHHGKEPDVTYAAQAFEYLVEEGEDAATGHLGNVVHRFTGVVPNPAVLVSKAIEHRRHQLVQVPPSLLQTNFKTKMKRKQQTNDEGYLYLLRGRKKA